MPGLVGIAAKKQALTPIAGMDVFYAVKKIFRKWIFFVDYFFFRIGRE